MHPSLENLSAFGVLGKATEGLWRGKEGMDNLQHTYLGTLPTLPTLPTHNHLYSDRADTSNIDELILSISQT